MHAAFGVVIWIVCGLGVVIGFVALVGSGRAWEEYAERGLIMDRDAGGAAGGSDVRLAAANAERDMEIRQMLEARNARRARRGEPPLDVDAEFSRLTAPAVDDALRAEIRDLVVARNYRRARRGQPPLDIEAEVEREIASLTSP